MFKKGVRAGKTLRDPVYNMSSGMINVHIDPEVDALWPGSMDCYHPVSQPEVTFPQGSHQGQFITMDFNGLDDGFGLPRIIGSTFRATRGHRKGGFGGFQSVNVL